MGLFDGITAKFADKLTDYLTVRQEARLALAQEYRLKNDTYQVLVSTVVAEALGEVIAAVRYVRAQ